MLRHPNGQGQITLPKPYLERLGVTTQDYFDVQLHGSSIVLTPVTVESRLTDSEVEQLQALFDRPTNRGRRFPSGQAALRYLKRRIKRA